MNATEKTVYFVVTRIIPELWSDIYQKLEEELFERIKQTPSIPPQVLEDLEKLKKLVDTYYDSKSSSNKTYKHKVIPIRLHRYDKYEIEKIKFHQKLSLYEIPIAEYSTIYSILEILGMRRSLAYTIADHLAKYRELIISTIDELIRENIGKCRGITLYVEGNEEAHIPRSLRELARKYNIELKFLDEGFPLFNRIIELFRETLPCYNPATINVDKCNELEKEGTLVEKRRKEYWAKKIVEENNSCVIVLIGERIIDEIINELLEKKIDYEILDLTRV